MLLRLWKRLELTVVLITAFSLFPSYPTERQVVSKVEVIKDTVIIRDTVYLQENNRLFQSYDDLVLFTTYLKTQSGRLDDDNWAVIQTLFNRCRKDNITFREYFNNPDYNRSRTIRLMQSNKLDVSYNPSDELDRNLLRRVINAYFGYNPTNCPSDVLYFESHSKSPNRGVFLKSKIWREYRHKFYYGSLKD